MTCITFQEEKAEQISIYQSFICPYTHAKGSCCEHSFRLISNQVKQSNCKQGLCK